MVALVVVLVLVVVFALVLLAMRAWGVREGPSAGAPSVPEGMEAGADQLSARLTQPFVLGPAGHGPVVSVRDVVICPGTDTDVSPEEFREHPPVGFPLFGLPEDEIGPVELGREARLDRLPHEEAELVMNACTPRGHYFVPVRQFSQLYTFVCDVNPAVAQESLTWDRDSVLGDALMLSRLVRDNHYSTQYAARGRADGDVPACAEPVCLSLATRP
jgi:hypothetical protein